MVEWKLAPRSDGPSPAQLFFRRQVRSGNLAEISRPLDIKEAIRQKEESQRKCRVRGTVRHTRQPMSLHQNVLLQDRESKQWLIKGRVVAIRQNGRSYVIQTENGTYLRGMRFVKAALSAYVFLVVSAGKQQLGKLVRPALSSGISRASKPKKRVRRSVPLSEVAP